MTITKTAERTIMEQVAAIIIPHTMHAETYGLSACYDFLIAWQRALDCDMPLACFQRDEAERKHQEAMATAEAKRIVDNANRVAADMIKAADLETKRMRAAMTTHLHAARRAIDQLI